MAILYTWRLNCRKRQLSSDMHLPRDQVCEFKARHPLCWATASLTPQFCVRNQHMHLCNTGKRQESKRRVVMEWPLRWLHRLRTRQHWLEPARGGAELGTFGESTPAVGLIITPPWSQLLPGPGSPSARACTDSQRRGSFPSLPQTRGAGTAYNWATPSHPCGIHGTTSSEKLSTDKLNSSPVMAAICEASHTKLLLQLIVNFGLFLFIFLFLLLSSHGTASMSRMRGQSWRGDELSVCL